MPHLIQIFTNTFVYFHRVSSNACQASSNVSDPGADPRRCIQVQCTISLGCCCNWKSGRINRLQNIRNSIPIQAIGGQRNSNNARAHYNTRRALFGGWLRQIEIL